MCVEKIGSASRKFLISIVVFRHGAFPNAGLGRDGEGVGMTETETETLELVRAELFDTRETIKGLSELVSEFANHANQLSAQRDEALGRAELAELVLATMGICSDG